MKKIFLFLILLLLFLTSFIKSKIFAQEKEFVFTEDFSGNLNKWEELTGIGDWQLIDGQLKGIVTSKHGQAILVPKDEYWPFGIKNFEYEFDYTPIGDPDKNFTFALEDKDNWYELHFAYSTGGFVLDKVENGMRVWQKAGKTEPLVLNAKHRIKIKFNQGQITAWINNNKIIEVTDPNYENDFGKIALKVSTGSDAYGEALFDNIYFKANGDFIENKFLPVKYFKQTDIAWTNELYDNADAWDLSKQFGIGRWGCALTSLAMILDYHGINEFPNGQNLDPKTLNTWLKNQPDGYIGEGLVNWLAATRLTFQQSQNLGTPKLEYARVNGNNIQTSVNEINQNKPTILEIDGHFMVSNGYTQAGQELAILDPAFNFNRFSNHQTELLSTRTFQPSQTDLSYLMFISPNNLNFELFNEAGEKINLEIFSERLRKRADGSASYNDKLFLAQLAKPQNGQYTLKISQENLSEYELKIYGYDIKANPQIITKIGILGSNPLEIKFTYSKQTNLDNLKEAYGFENLKQDLDNLYDQKYLQSRYAYLRFDRLITAGIKYPSRQSKYLSQLNAYLSIYKKYFSQTATNYLQDKINLLQEQV